VTNPDKLARLLKSASGQGKTPLTNVVFVFHWAVDPVPAAVMNWNDVADVKLNSNTYADAKMRKGPVRGWFTRNATLRALACLSDNYAEAIADAYLPQGAKAYGTEHWTLVHRNHTRAGMDYDDDTEWTDDSETSARTLAEHFALEGWAEHDGQQ
jgi:hypothetical protein